MALGGHWVEETGQLTLPDGGAEIVFEVIDVGRTMATEWIAKSMYADQRKVRDYHVDELAGLMRRSKFRAYSKIEFVWWDGAWHCVDGQHTLNAIVKSEVTIRLLVVRRKATTFADLAEQYATHGREMPRSPADLLKGLGVANKFDLELKDLVAFYTAVRLPLGNFHNISVNEDVALAHDVLYVVDKMHEWRTAAARFFAATATTRRRDLRPRLRTAGVMGVALATFRGAPRTVTVAEDFWRGVSLADGLRAGDPRLALVDYLTAWPTRTSALTRARTVAPCWNRFYGGRELKIARPSFNDMLGITLAGTGYKASKANGGPPAAEEEQATP